MRHPELLVGPFALASLCLCQILEGEKVFLDAIEILTIGQLRHAVTSCGRADAMYPIVRTVLDEVELALHGTDACERWDANPHLSAVAPILVH